MKISEGTMVWVVVDNNGKLLGVWNSYRHAADHAERKGLDRDANVKSSIYLGGI